MKQVLNRYRLLFDAECAICRFASNSLRSSRLVGKENIGNYQSAKEPFCLLIDQQRAANEMAVIDLKTNEVTYGIRGILALTAEACPRLQPVLSSSLFIRSASVFYRLFSTNRRVIVPSSSETPFAVQPQFNLKYRLIWIGITGFISGFIISLYLQSLSDILPFENSATGYLIVYGQVLFQGSLVYLLNKDKLWDYLGNLMSVSMGGSMLLLPVLLAGYLFELSYAVHGLWALIIAVLMITEHIRRCRLMGLGLSLTISWIIFCVCALWL